jgi:hypothetical protein
MAPTSQKAKMLAGESYLATDPELLELYDTFAAGAVVGTSFRHAGGVVTRDLPPDVLAVGNRCRVLRSVKSEREA